MPSNSEIDNIVEETKDTAVVSSWEGLTKKKKSW